MFFEKGASLVSSPRSRIPCRPSSPRPAPPGARQPCPPPACGACSSLPSQRRPLPQRHGWRVSGALNCRTHLSAAAAPRPRRSRPSTPPLPPSCAPPAPYGPPSTCHLTCWTCGPSRRGMPRLLTALPSSCGLAVQLGPARQPLCPPPQPPLPRRPPSRRVARPPQSPGGRWRALGRCRPPPRRQRRRRRRRRRPYRQCGRARGAQRFGLRLVAVSSLLPPPRPWRTRQHPHRARPLLLPLMPPHLRPRTPALAPSPSQSQPGWLSRGPTYCQLWRQPPRAPGPPPRRAC